MDSNHLRFAALCSILFVCACGSIENDGDQKAEPPKVGDSIEFSGYVQRAFAITVEGITFNDSEHFYTRFIEDLILANEQYREGLQGAEIDIEGEYAVDRFGRNARVFLSSEFRDGHLYEAATNEQGKFSIKVGVNALDETFKARLVARIGLRITFDDDSTDRYCYLLHSVRDRISISEGREPIIFDQFSTQLNTYDCEQVSQLQIPYSDDPRDDVGTVKGADGDYTHEPYVAIGDVIRISAPLAEDEEGDNSLVSAAYDSASGALVIAKGQVRNLTDGTIYSPGLVLSDFSQSPERKKIDLGGKWRPVSAFPWQGGVLALSANTPRTMIYAGYGEEAQSISDDIQYFESSFFFYDAETLRYASIHNSAVAKTCAVDLDTSTILRDCVVAPSSNLYPSRAFRSCTFLNRKFFCLAKEESRIYTYNNQLVFQKKYVVSKLLMPKSEFDSARLVTFGDSVFFLTLASDALIFREIAFNE